MNLFPSPVTGDSRGKPLSLKARMVDFTMVSDTSGGRRDWMMDLTHVSKYFYRTFKGVGPPGLATCKLSRGGLAKTIDNTPARSTSPPREEYREKRQLFGGALTSFRNKKESNRQRDFTIKTFLFCRGYTDITAAGVGEVGAFFQPCQQLSLTNLRPALAVQELTPAGYGTPQNVFSYSIQGLVHDIGIDALNNIQLTNQGLRRFSIEFNDTPNVTIVFPEIDHHAYPKYNNAAYIQMLVGEIGNIFNHYRELVLKEEKEKYSHARYKAQEQPARLVFVGCGVGSDLRGCIARFINSYIKLPVTVRAKCDTYQRWFFCAMMGWPLTTPHGSTESRVTPEEFLRRVKFITLEEYYLGKAVELNF